MKTDFETLKVLAAYLSDLLKEHKFIEFDIDKRENLIESMAVELGVSFATDEDIQDQAIEEVEEKMGEVPDDVIESEIYNHARKKIIKSFNGENLGGLYLVESLHQVSHRMNSFLLNEDLIDDVYGTDEDIQQFVIQKVRLFSPKKN